jgi:HAE1 family hydrophobic/amphiphilic exporter-1
MPSRLRLGASLGTACALVAGLALPAAAQTPPSTQPPAVQAPATTPTAKGLEPTGPPRAITVDEAVKLALQFNLGIQVERYNPELQDWNTAQVLSNYTPVFGAGVFTQSQDNPPNSFLSGATETVSTDNFGVTSSFQKLFTWGMDATVQFDSGRQTSNNAFSSFDPTLSGNLDVVVIQPLLRNFKFDLVKQQLYESRKNREIADIDLRQTVALTTRTVKNAYWDYVYAINALKVARQTLDLAQESLRNTRSRVEIGTLAPIDIVQAESEVASREEAVILAEASIGQSEDRLRSLIFDPKEPGFFDIRLEPTDLAPFAVQEVDVTAAVQNALRDRTDLAAVKKRLEITDYNVRYFKNQSLPFLDARFDYNSTGLGGTQLVRDPDSPQFPPPIIGEINRSYGDVIADIFGFNFPTWRISLNVSYPIGTSNADASLARTRIEKTQAETSLRQLELNIATEVRDAGRQLVANSKRVEATRAARVLAERRLEAEEKKFAAGMSTSFEVFQAQRDLALARSNELRAVLDYTQSQVDFETVQISPTGGGGTFNVGGALQGAVGAAVAGSTTAGGQ